MVVEALDVFVCAVRTESPRAKIGALVAKLWKVCAHEAGWSHLVRVGSATGNAYCQWHQLPLDCALHAELTHIRTAPSTRMHANASGYQVTTRDDESEAAGGTSLAD